MGDSTCLTLSRYILHAEYGQSVSMGQSRQRSAAPAGLEKYLPHPILPPIFFFLDTGIKLKKNVCICSHIQMAPHTLSSFLKRLRDPNDDTFRHLQVNNGGVGAWFRSSFNDAICLACDLRLLAVYLRVPTQWWIRSMSWHDLAKRENELSASFLQFPRTNACAKW